MAAWAQAAGRRNVPGFQGCTRGFLRITRKGQLDASETRIRLLRNRRHLRLHRLSPGRPISRFGWRGRSRGASRSCRRGIPEEHYRTVEIEKLRQLLQGQDGAPAAVEEPMLPVPAERFLTEPVHARCFIDLAWPLQSLVGRIACSGRGRIKSQGFFGARNAYSLW
jgi:hypothetical protein